MEPTISSEEEKDDLVLECNTKTEFINGRIEYAFKQDNVSVHNRKIMRIQGVLLRNYTCTATFKNMSSESCPFVVKRKYMCT